MKKEDLKSGMIVECRNGKLGLLIATDLGLLIQYDTTWEELSVYNSDLTHVKFKESDIINIRKPSNESHIIRSQLSNAPIIWKQYKEMTMEDISKALGYDVKIIKG